MSAIQDADHIVARLKDHLGTADRLEPASLAALGEWLDRVGRLSKVVLNTRFDQRQVRLTEEQGRQLAEVIQNVLQDLALTPAQEAAAPGIVVRELKRVAALEERS